MYNGLIGYNVALQYTPASQYPDYNQQSISMYDNCYNPNLSLTMPCPPSKIPQPPPLLPAAGIGSISLSVSHASVSVPSLGSPQSMYYDKSWGSNTSTYNAMDMSPPAISSSGTPSNTSV